MTELAAPPVPSHRRALARHVIVPSILWDGDAPNLRVIFLSMILIYISSFPPSKHYKEGASQRKWGEPIPSILWDEDAPNLRSIGLSGMDSSPVIPHPSTTKKEIDPAYPWSFPEPNACWGATGHARAEACDPPQPMTCSSYILFFLFPKFFVLTKNLQNYTIATCWSSAGGIFIIAIWIHGIIFFCIVYLKNDKFYIRA